MPKKKKKYEVYTKMSTKVYLLKYEQLKWDTDRIKQIYIYYIIITLFAFSRFMEHKSKLLITWQISTLYNYIINIQWYFCS